MEEIEKSPVLFFRCASQVSAGTVTNKNEAEIREDYIPMRITLTLTTLFLLLSGTALAGSGYDACLKEQSALEAREASECSGFRYLFNPSPCFTTQRALREYTTTDKCKNIGIAEHVDFSVQPVSLEEKVGGDGMVDGGNPVAVKKPEPEVPHQENTCEQLKEENTLLKAEVLRLKTENEQLRKMGQ